MLEYLEGVDTHSRVTADALFATLTHARLLSNAVPQTRLFGRPLSSVRITDFFGSVVSAVPTEVAYPGFSGDVAAATTNAGGGGDNTRAGAAKWTPYVGYNARQTRRIDEVGMGHVDYGDGRSVVGGVRGQLTVGVLSVAMLAAVALTSLVAY